MDAFQALVLSLPTHNSTLRMRLWRALKESGSGVLRDGVYVLPDAAANGALGKLEAEIRSHGGFAMTLQLLPRTAEQLQELRKLFDRSGEYAGLAQKLLEARASLERLGARRGQTAIRRLERAFQRLSAIDFFAGEAKAQAAGALAELKNAYASMHSGGEPRFSKRGLRPLERKRFQKRLWATRKAPWVDRLASAWLIKRFIDREAKFAWIARPSECPKKAIGFDYDGADFTHVKNRVTFEVLMASFALDTDPALAAIGRAVHFLDVGGIPVPDAKGLETMLKGAKEKARSDDALLAEAMRTFDNFYSAYRIQARFIEGRRDA
jgi:hypothetical protein